MTPLLVALGGALTVAGSALLVVAFRRSLADDAAGERRLFRLAVGGLAVGSLVLLLAMVSATPA